jgi:peptide/nickel transport system permease protein
MTNAFMIAVLRRCADAAATLVALVTLTFVLARAMPGGAAYAILGLRANPASVAELDRRLALDVPLWRQYGLWWWHVLHGRLGTSYLLSRDVRGVLAEFAGNTLALDALGLVLAVALGIGLGVAHGVAQGKAKGEPGQTAWAGRRWLGRAIGAAELFFYAMPGFFIGSLLLMVFSAWLHWLPAGGVVDLRLEHPGLADRLRHMVLPACSLALLWFAGFSRVMAASVQTELARDYVRTARARGLGEAAILFRHVLPNALHPVVTLLGLAFPALFAGSVVVESVFSYPGLGWLLWRSAVSHDDPVLVAIVLVIGVATIAGNLGADVLNSWLDPAARYV